MNRIGGPNLRNMIVNNIIENHKFGIKMRMGVDNIVFGNSLIANRIAYSDGGFENSNNLFSQNTLRDNGEDIRNLEKEDTTQFDCFIFPTKGQVE